MNVVRQLAIQESMPDKVVIDELNKPRSRHTYLHPCFYQKERVPERG